MKLGRLSLSQSVKTETVKLGIPIKREDKLDRRVRKGKKDAAHNKGQTEDENDRQKKGSKNGKFSSFQASKQMIVEKRKSHNHCWK